VVVNENAATILERWLAVDVRVDEGMLVYVRDRTETHESGNGPTDWSGGWPDRAHQHARGDHAATGHRWVGPGEDRPDSL
jgi:hypothetical protein